MDQVRPLALLVLPALVVGCRGGHHASHAPLKAPFVLGPAQFAVRPNISDPLCNGGHGLRLRALIGGNPVIAAGAMRDGSTLIAVSDYDTRNTVDLYAVSGSCVPLREFGTAGRATITPSSRPPRHTNYETLPDALYVNAVAPSTRGALVAGSYGGRWVVGAVTRRGRLDPTFGDRGWAVLPFHGEVTAIARAPSGRIVLAGEWQGAAVLSARGRLERTFGKNGRAALPFVGSDSGIQALAVEPNGEILADVGFGNNGCWRAALAMITPSGQPVPRFRSNLGPFGSFWRRLGFNAFVGDAYTDDDGFTLVGTGQRPCAATPATASAPSATGLIARFREDGQPASPMIRFPSRMYGEVWAFREGNDTVVVKAPYADMTRLALTAIRPNGSLDSQFGDRGRASIRAPWRRLQPAFDTLLCMTPGGPRTLVVVATRDGRNELQLIRVRLGQGITGSRARPCTR